MATYHQIKRFLEDHQTSTKLDQFTIDWIEREIDTWEGQEQGGIFIDDETANDATNYRAETVLDIMRPDARGRWFFEALELLTRKATERVNCSICGSFVRLAVPNPQIVHRTTLCGKCR